MSHESWADVGLIISSSIRHNEHIYVSVRAELQPRKTEPEVTKKLNVARVKTVMRVYGVSCK